MDSPPASPTLLSRFWPAGLLLAFIWLSSSTVITSREWVRMVTQTLPIHMTEESFRAWWLEWWWLFVKGWHATEFAILFLVVRHALREKALWWSAAIAATFAALDELHQLSVPARGCHLSDWLIDCIGIASVWALLACPKRRRWWLLALTPFAVALIRFLALTPF